MSSSDASATGTRVLFAYFTFTQQSLNVDGTHLSFAGGQVRSLLSLVSYFGNVHGSKTGSALPRTEHNGQPTDTTKVSAHE